ncbi:hypothetical protein IJ670_07225, partial [bacterium]|nr:hypothetical protein [bacterium]
AQILYKAPKPKATPTIQPIRSFVPINKSLDNDKRVISSTASIDTFREVIPYSKISHVIVLASYLLDNNPEIEMKDMINQISIKTKITPQNVETILNAYRFKDI